MKRLKVAHAQCLQVLDCEVELRWREWASTLRSRQRAGINPASGSDVVDDARIISEAPANQLGGFSNERGRF